MKALVMIMKTLISAMLLLWVAGCASMFGLDASPPRPAMRSDEGSNVGGGITSIMYYAPAWGPDTNGEEVVYFLKQVTFSSRNDEQSRIYFCSVKPDGSERREITQLWKENPDQYFENFMVAVSMDVNAATKRAAIGVELGERGGIFTVGVDGSGFRSLWPKEWKEDRPDKAGCPTWSPDGKWIAFHEYRFRGGSNLYQIVKCRPDASDYTLLTERQACNSEPAWSPEGTEIAYVRYPKFYPNASYLSFMNSDGSDRRETKLDGNLPRWSPDGRFVLHESHSVVDPLLGTTVKVYRAGKDRQGLQMWPKWGKSGFVFVDDKKIGLTSPEADKTVPLLKNVSKPITVSDYNKEAFRW